MPSAIKTTTEALQEVHAAILDDLGKLPGAAAASSPEALIGLRARLAEAHKQVTEHFRSEEEGGVLAGIEKCEPRFKRGVQHLVDEHSRLMQWLDALISQAGAATQMNESIRAGIRTWLDKVRDHESRENKLVEDAILTDVGSGD